MNNNFSLGDDIEKVKHLIGPDVKIKMHDISEDLKYFKISREDYKTMNNKTGTFTCADHPHLPMVSYNIDRIEPANSYYTSSTIVYNLRISFCRQSAAGLDKDDIQEIEKVTNFIYALSLLGYTASSVEVITWGMEKAITYMCIVRKKIKSKSC